MRRCRRVSSGEVEKAAAVGVVRGGGRERKEGGKARRRWRKVWGGREGLRGGGERWRGVEGGDKEVEGVGGRRQGGGGGREVERRREMVGVTSRLGAL